MKGLVACFILLSGLIFTVSAKDVFEDHVKPKNSYIDVLAESLTNEVWGNEDYQCVNQLLAVLNNARNFTLAATWILDSMHLPVGVLYGSHYQLGNYDQCMRPPWLKTHPELRTQYCLADIKLTNQDPQKSKQKIDPYGSTEDYMNTLTRYDRELNSITWGVCLPAICPPATVSKILKTLLSTSHFGPATFNSTITLDTCQVAGKPHQYTTAFYIFFLLILSLVVIAVLSTYYKADANSHSTVADVAKAFSIARNWNDLVKDTKDDIPALHGIRTFTAIILVFTHQVFFSNSGPIGNGLDVDRDFDNIYMFLHADLLTDTFLFMSGMLLIKGLMGRWDRLESPLMVLGKRYIRLVGPIALIVFYLTAASVHLGSGPLWDRLAGQEQKHCVQNWWVNLLMLNNYVHTDEMCFISLWYMPADFHLTIMGVVLFYLYRRHRRAGIVTFGALTVLSILLPAVATYWNELPATIMYNTPTMLDIRTNPVFKSTYTRSHYRGSSYLIGVATGFLLSVVKPGKPFLSKRWCAILFPLLFALAIVPMAVGGAMYTTKYNALESALFAGWNRALWALVMSAIVLTTVYGEFPLINSLLSWRVLAPLGKLSYGMYLAHPIAIQRNVFAARMPRRQDLFTMLVDSFGVAAFGYMMSLLIWLLVEAPIVNLMNLILYPKRKQTIKKDVGIREENGEVMNQSLRHEINNYTKDFPTKENGQIVEAIINSTLDNGVKSKIL